MRTASDSGGKSIPSSVNRTSRSDANRTSATPNRSGTRCIPAREIAGDGSRAAFHHNPLRILIKTHLDMFQTAVGEVGMFRRNRISRRCQSNKSSCGSFSHSPQFSRDRSKVSAACGSGTSSTWAQKAANSRRRPSVTARPKLRVFVIGEIKKRRAGAPFLALKKHRNKWRGHDQRRGDFRARRTLIK